ncbi:MAG: MBOAT family protein, partial [Bacteroidales bacterium]|nr:MBOAT family protein [Bacteroidales bacterium]
MTDFLQIAADFLKGLFTFDQSHPLLFTQFYFWAFFAIVFALFALFKNKLLLRNGFLFFASVFFYYKTSGIFTLILLFVTLYNFLGAKWMYSRKSEKGKRAVLVLSLIVNLLLLCYFKYAYFITDVVNNLFGTEFAVFDVFAVIGNAITDSNRFSVDSIILPVGISFYIFQTISYIMDVYRNQVAPVRNILNFGFYVSFFPSLVAGPILRASEFIPQLHRKFFLGRRQFGIAVFWIINGLIKKIVLSDYIAVNFIDRVFENPLLYSGFENVMALFGYSLQVYADFSGYTDIAIGVAMLMGFYLPQNFNSPYKAKHPGEFWKRWHISLSRWLKDYLYIPLGGNRNATFGTYCCIVTISLIGVLLAGSWLVALVVLIIAVTLLLLARFRPEKRRTITTNLNSMNTMLLGGLWHGASWNFMIWGGLNGLGMVIHKIWKNWGIGLRFFVIALITATLGVLSIAAPRPLFNLFFVWMAVVMIGNLVKLIYVLICRLRGVQAAVVAGPEGSKEPRFRRLSDIWAIFQTFVFITFTRLFFRSGSNLDPAEANETAWNTAKNMVNRIGSHWELSMIPEIVWQYRNVFLLIVAGMVIHWFPDRFKRRYRLWFASMPLPLMVLIVALAVF